MNKINYAELLRKYLSNDLESSELISANKSFIANRNVVRGTSTSIPNISNLGNFKITCSILEKLKFDVISGQLSKELCVFWIDVITLNSEEIDLEDGCLEVLETINSIEDLDVWINSKKN